MEQTDGTITKYMVVMILWCQQMDQTNSILDLMQVKGWTIPRA